LPFQSQTAAPVYFLEEQSASASFFLRGKFRGRYAGHSSIDIKELGKMNNAVDEAGNKAADLILNIMAREFRLR